jgi:hypothetical protein
MYTKKSFQWVLKIISDIWRPPLATHCWRRPRKFFITLRVSSGWMESISCWILSFKSSRDRRRYLKTFSFRYPQKKKSHGCFDRARSVYRTLSESLSQNGCSHNTLQQQSADVHRFNLLWVLKTVEANQPNDTTPHLFTPTTARTVPPRNVGDLYALPCIIQHLVSSHL